ncbi:MAG: hypothetical protein AB8H86_24250, partial [Polyangiales bacterium]
MRPRRHWSLADVDWAAFRADLVDARTLWIVHATCLVESRADLYAAYTGEVVRGASQPGAEDLIHEWGEEEAQHGHALQAWLALADPETSFAERDEDYRSNVAYYVADGTPVRGSVQNELFCRCIVEALASAYYRAIHDSTEEPVLRELCVKLARDEARHFSMFRRLLMAEREKGANSLWRNTWLTLRRVKELENDQVAYAFHCSGPEGESSCYGQKDAARRFLPNLYDLYEPEHLEYAGRLVAKAFDIRLPSQAFRALALAATAYVRGRATYMRRA